MDDFQNGLLVGMIVAFVICILTVINAPITPELMIKNGKEIQIKNQYYTCSLIAEEKRVEVGDGHLHNERM